MNIRTVQQYLGAECSEEEATLFAAELKIHGYETNDSQEIVDENGEEIDQDIFQELSSCFFNR